MSRERNIALYTRGRNAIQMSYKPGYAAIMGIYKGIQFLSKEHAPEWCMLA